MVDQFDCQSYDYISNTANDDLLNVPDGLDVEIFLCQPFLELGVKHI